jgi:hypothetical protein
VRKFMLLGLAALTVTAAAGAASAQPRPYGDRDRDGVPNAYDPRPNDGPMGDRDRDGRPNAYDARDDRWDTRWGPMVRAPRYWGGRPGWNRHVRACFARYRTYNPRTDTYLIRPGVRVRCRL